MPIGGIVYDHEGVAVVLKMRFNAMKQMQKVHPSEKIFGGLADC